MLWAAIDVFAVGLALYGVMLFLTGIPCHLRLVRARRERAAMYKQTLLDVSDAQQILIARLASWGFTAEVELPVARRLRPARKSAQKSEMVTASKSAAGSDGLSKWFASMYQCLRVPGAAKSIPAALLTQQLDGLKTVLDELTGANCALCLHVFVSEGEVMALLRDTSSDSSRRANKRRRTIDGTTEFYQIIKAHRPCFASNDLESLPDYHNENADWSKTYKAVIAVPIQHTVNGAKEYLGFLCVDAPQKNAFDLESHARILVDAADLLCPLLVSYLGGLEVEYEADRLTGEASEWLTGQASDTLTRQISDRLETIS